MNILALFYKKAYEEEDKSFAEVQNLLNSGPYQKFVYFPKYDALKVGTQSTYHEELAKELVQELGVPENSWGIPIATGYMNPRDEIMYLHQFYIPTDRFMRTPSEVISNIIYKLGNVIKVIHMN